MSGVTLAQSPRTHFRSFAHMSFTPMARAARPASPVQAARESGSPRVNPAHIAQRRFLPQLDDKKVKVALKLGLDKRQN
jgi:hypothetical protein